MVRLLARGKSSTGERVLMVIIAVTLAVSLGVYLQDGGRGWIVAAVLAVVAEVALVAWMID